MDDESFTCQSQTQNPAQFLKEGQLGQLAYLPERADKQSAGFDSSA